MTVEFSAEYIQKVANVVRAKLTEASDGEIRDLAIACLYRLRGSGIKMLDPNDPLIRQAINYYAKANYGLDNDDKERNKKDFEALRIDLSLDSSYNTGEERYEA